MNQVKTNLFYKRPLFTDPLREKPENGFLFGYVQCDLIIPGKLRKLPFLVFLQFLKCLMSAETKLENKKNFAEENHLLKNLQRMLISSSKLETGPIGPFLLLSKS